MKKNFFALALLAVCLLAFSGCTPAREQTNATAAPTAPSPTEDISHVHSWVDASCTTPKTCSDCSLTEGEALGHSFSNWVPRQGNQYRICTICRYQETAALNLDDYYPIAEEALDGEYAIILIGNKDYPVSYHTLEKLSLEFSGRAGALSYDGQPVYSFDWTIYDVIPWSSDSFSQGISIVLTVPITGEQLLLDEKQIIIEGFELNISTEEKNTLSALSMVVSIDAQQMYLGFSNA